MHTPTRAQIYFNTTRISGEPLKIAHQQALKSREVVKLIFQKFPIEMTSADVYNIGVDSGYKFPITSYRRAITGLVGDGYLEDTGKLKIGNYGVSNIVWKLKSKP